MKRNLLLATLAANRTSVGIGFRAERGRAGARS